MLTDQFLLKGAGLSLKNAENLINAAVSLVDNNFLPQAVALASFAHEQLGQFRILEEIYFDTKSKKTTTTSLFKKRLEDRQAHLYKQMKGISSIAMTFPKNSEEGKLNNNFLKAVKEHNFKKIKELDKAREELVNRRKKRLPQERIKLRLRSLYVDINEDGDDWISPQSNLLYAFNFVAQTCGDYGSILQYTIPGLKSVNKTAKFLNKIMETIGIKYKQSNWPSSPIDQE